MEKKVLQFRYKADGDIDNFPSGISNVKLVNGEIFKNPIKVTPISQLGIQALPGTKFYLNGAVNPIVMGVSGIYDLDIKNGARVTDLRFAKNSIDNIENSINGYLIVDVLYGEEDE